MLQRSWMALAAKTLAWAILSVSPASAQSFEDLICNHHLPYWRNEVLTAHERYRDDPVAAENRRRFAMEVVERYSREWSTHAHADEGAAR